MVDADPVNASAVTCQLDTKALAVAESSAEDRLIGRDVIGQYRIEKKLGSGGMGAVYLAQQTTVQRPAVIKVLKAHATDKVADKLDLAARFAIEARAASNLNHPNIVTIYNYGSMDDGTLFIAMEYLAGETLEDRIARCGALPGDCAVHVATQIARALGEAHARGVVHRDLKPANVMLVNRAGESDFVKVLDFGIAKLDDAGVTSTGYVVGTPRYMSPEQLLGKQLDRRSDVYSAAVVLYEMLAGVTPFSSDTPIGWLHQHVEAIPKPPSALSKGKKIVPALERVVLRALSKAPTDRPATMEEFADDLEAAMREPPPPAWWQVTARTIGRKFVNVYHLVGALLVAFGVGAWRSVRATAQVARSLGSSTWRAVRSVGRGVRGSARSLRSGLLRLCQVARAGTRRIYRAFRSVLRFFVITMPVYFAKLVDRGARSLVMTKRRRSIVMFSVIVAFAITSALLFPSTFDRLLLDNKPMIGKTKSNYRSPARSPARDKRR